MNERRVVLVLNLSGRNEKGRPQNNESENVFVVAKVICLPPEKDYVGGATC